MEQITGKISNIIFNNQENGYSVFELETVDELVICVGIFPSIKQGLHVTLDGRSIEHIVYGSQFSFQDIKIHEPKRADDIYNYLAQGAIKGIGKKTAKSIVDRFGEESLEIMEHSPDALAQIKGISKKKAIEISQSLSVEKKLRNAIIFLQRSGISIKLAIRLYEKYNEGIYDIVNKTPYRLVEDFAGIGFKTADKIALSIGFLEDSSERITAGIYYTIIEAQNDGHVYLPKDELIERANKLLNCNIDMIDNPINDLAIAGKIVIKVVDDEEVVYSRLYYNMERNIAYLLKKLRTSPSEYNELEILEDIDSEIKILGMIPDNEQKKAVLEAFKENILIVTGGPGTGKTTVINTIIRLFEKRGETVLLAAPTGRAAKRISESTDREATTVHRLLGIKNLGEDGNYFERDENYPLEAKLIVIDEMSMIDMPLMYALLKAIPVGARLIMTGDVDQLPSVGVGSVLNDIIASGIYNVVKLKKIFRQAAESDIIVNAHRINEGNYPIINGKNDFFFIERNDVKSLINTILFLIMKKLPDMLSISSYDVQVLCPMKKGILGVHNLNQIIQKVINAKDDLKNEHKRESVIFREGDKVMQIKNNYKIEWEKKAGNGAIIENGLGVFNGDMGIIDDINNFSSTVTVRFDDNRYVNYNFSHLDELELAYAITIHKSQGSEYPAVIIPLLNTVPMLSTRNLLYTAVTRAKNFEVVLGSYNCIKDMVDRVDTHTRYTSLSERIREYEDFE